MYEQTESAVQIKNKETDNKINIICEKLIATFEQLNNTRYFISTLSCLAKMNNLDEALKKIIKIRSKYLIDLYTGVKLMEKL